MAVENFPAGGRKAQSEPRDRFRVEPPIFQIGARSLALQRALELLHKKRRRLAMHLHQRRALLVFAAFFRRTLAGTRNRNAALFRNDSHRVGEFAFLHLPHEAEDVTADAASETVINLLHRMDRERRRLLRMKRAEPRKILPALFQADVLAHHADNVRLLLHTLRKGSRFRHVPGLSAQFYYRDGIPAAFFRLRRNFFNKRVRLQEFSKPAAEGPRTMSVDYPDSGLV